MEESVRDLFDNGREQVAFVNWWERVFGKRIEGYGVARKAWIAALDWNRRVEVGDEQG